MAVQVGGITSALQGLVQVNRAAALDRERERERRRAERAGGVSNLGAIAGGILGAVYGGPQGAALGAGAGATLGRAFGGGAPVQAGEAIQLGAGVAGLQQQMEQQQQREAMGRAESGILTMLQPSAQQMALEPGMSGPGDMASHGEAAGLAGMLQAAGKAPAGQRLSILGAALQAQQAMQPAAPQFKEVNGRLVQTNASGGPSVALDLSDGGSGKPFEGTGLSAQDSNALVVLGQKAADGGWDSLSPQEQRTYRLAYARATREEIIQVPQPDGTVQTKLRHPLELEPIAFPPPGDRKAKDNGEPPPSQQPGNGGRVIGTKNPTMSVNDAGRLQMIRTAQDSFSRVKGAVIMPDGTVNRLLVASMAANLPRTEGRQRRQEMRDVLATKLRLETGAQANDHELDDMMARFMPSPGDRDDAIISKMERLDGFLQGSLDLAAVGRGVLSQETLRKASQQKAEQGIPTGSEQNPAAPTTQKAFDDLPSGAWFINPADGRLLQKR